MTTPDFREGLDALEQGRHEGERLAIFGAGYIGGTLAALALRGGMQVTALTRNREKAEQLEAAGVHKVVVAALDDSGWHAHVDPRQHYVVNCVSSAGGGLAGYRRSYVDGTRSIMEWAQQCPEKCRYVFTSSTSVYPQADGQWVDENTPVEGPSESGAILLEAERHVAEGNFPQWWILRLAGIYGPGRHFLLDSILEGRASLAGSGETYLNLAHQWDIARAILEVLLNPDIPAGRIYNVCDGQPHRKREIVQWLAEQVDKPAPEFTPGDIGSRGSRRMNAEGRLPNRRISNERLRQESRWNPRYSNFREGFRDMLTGV